MQSIAANYHSKLRIMLKMTYRGNSMNATSLPSARKGRLILPNRHAVRCTALGLLALALAACGNQAVSATTTPASTATETHPTSIPTLSHLPTATEVPNPEATFEQLTLMDASIGSFAQDEEGNLIYNSPLYNTEVGKNIPVVQEYREVGLDGGEEVWIAPEKYPNAPIVIQDLDTGEIRQGPFEYDNDVRRRLTVPNSPAYEGDEGVRSFRGSIPLSGTIDIISYPGYWDTYGISVVLTGNPVEKNGHLVMSAKSYVGDESDMLSFPFNISLGSTETSGGDWWGPFYETYVGNNRRYFYLSHIISNAGNFQERYSLFSQVILNGIFNVRSRDIIPSGHQYATNAYYSQENATETNEIISILQTGGVPALLREEVNYEDLSLYGVIMLILK